MCSRARRPRRGADPRGTAAGVNQIQVRFKARSCEEMCDQMAAFATEVAPLLATIA